MKLKKILAFTLALVLAIGCTSITAFADETAVESSSSAVVWDGGSYVVSGAVTISGGVTVNGDVTLTLNEGATLTVTGTDGDGTYTPGAPIMGGDGKEGKSAMLINGNLTVNGGGTLNLTGGSGHQGGEPKNSVGKAGIGGVGGSGIEIASGASLTLNSGCLNATGGSGGKGGKAEVGSNGANGGTGLFCEGAVTVSGGTLTATGGAGGAAGENTGSNPRAWGQAGTQGDGAVSKGTSFTVSNGTFNANANYKCTGFRGLLTVNGGNVNLYSYKDDGRALTVTGGSLNVSTSLSASGSPMFTVSGGKLKAGSYTFPSNAGNRSITGGIFSMDVSNYIGDSYKCVSNTDDSTKDDYPYMLQILVSGLADLDLEADTTDIPVSRSLDEYYTKAEAGPNYVYNHKILVTWYPTPMQLKVADAKKWDIGKLEWVTDSAKDGVATLEEGTNVKEFTLTNYSAKAFDCSLTFAVNSALSSDLQSSYVEADTTITNDNTATSGRLDAVINDAAAMTTDSKYFTDDGINTDELPTLKFTATLGVDTTKFNGIAATTEPVKYGTFTVKLDAVNN